MKLGSLINYFAGTSAEHTKTSYTVHSGGKKGRRWQLTILTYSWIKNNYE